MKKMFFPIQFQWIMIIFITFVCPVNAISAGVNPLEYAKSFAQKFITRENLQESEINCEILAKTPLQFVSCETEVYELLDKNNEGNTIIKEFQGRCGFVFKKRGADFHILIEDCGIFDLADD